MLTEEEEEVDADVLNEGTGDDSADGPREFGIRLGNVNQ